jgi:hypothetical protein
MNEFSESDTIFNSVTFFPQSPSRPLPPLKNDNDNNNGNDNNNIQTNATLSSNLSPPPFFSDSLNVNSDLEKLSSLH